MLSLRSSSNTAERDAEAGGSRAIQTGRETRKSRASKGRERKAHSAIIRGKPRPLCRWRKMEKVRIAANGRLMSHPSGNSNTIAAVIPQITFPRASESIFGCDHDTQAAADSDRYW